MSLFEPSNSNLDTDQGWRRHLSGLVVFVLVALTYGFGGLDWLEYKLMDSRFAYIKKPASNTIVHVGIDSRSLRELDTWPWPRRYHAKLIRQLHAAGAARIVLDVDFSSASTPEADAELAAAIEAAGGRVVLPVFKQRAANNTGAMVYTEPLDKFIRFAQTASMNVRPERDSLVRRYNRVEAWQGTFVPSMATQLSGTLPNMLEPFYIDFSIRPASIPHLSYVDILRDRFSPADVDGKIVFVGASAIELGDMLAVPVYGAVSGTVLQALAYESLKFGNAIQRTLPPWSYAAALILALILRPLLSEWNWQRGLLLTMLVLGAGYGGSVWVQSYLPLSLDITPVLAVMVLCFLWSLIRRLNLQSIRIFKQNMAAVYRRAIMNSVFDVSLEGIIIANADGRVEFVNAAACNLFDRQPDDIVGENVLRFLQPEDFGDETSDWVDGETGYRVIRPSEVLDITTKAGAKIPIELSIVDAKLAPGVSPFEQRTDTRSVFIYTFRDIREREMALAALRSAADKAIAAERAKSELIANVSHELRTPLNAIIGFSEIMNAKLFGPLGSDKYTGYVKDIQFSGEHLLELVNNLLAVSHLDAGKYELSESFIDVSAAVDSCLNLISGSHESDEVTIENAIPHDLPRILADSQAIRRIILNLVGNAVKFTPRLGEIRIDADIRPNGDMALVIADTGIGIPSDQLESIVEPFHQVEGSSQRQFGGVGLGLYIVRRLIDLHDGRLEIDSILGKGTRVSLIIPRVRIEGFDNVVSLINSQTRRAD